MTEPTTTVPVTTEPTTDAMRQTPSAADVARVQCALAGMASEIMRQSARSMLRLMQREDLSMPRMVTLLFLDRSGSASISAIAEHLNLSLAATSQLVEKLVGADLATRIEHADDRRQKQVGLSAAGTRLAVEIRAMRVSDLARQIACLPEATVAAFVTGCEAALAQLGREG